MLQGSPCHPLFRVWDDGGRHRTQIAIPFADAIAERKLPAHFVAFDRLGLTSFDGGSAKNEPRSCTKDRGGVDKAERVADAIAVIRAFRDLPWVSELWVAGHSEGGDVATGVMHAAPELVRATGVFAGAGPSQFFDDVETARRDGDHAAAEATFLALDAFASGAPPASSPVDDLRGCWRRSRSSSRTGRAIVTCPSRAPTSSWSRPRGKGSARFAISSSREAATASRTRRPTGKRR